MKQEILKGIACFAGGVLFGTAGIKLLSGRDAKKVYVYTTAGVLRVKDFILDAVNKVQENAEDILAEAKIVKERCQAKDEVIEDYCCTEAEDASGTASETDDASDAQEV